MERMTLIFIVISIYFLYSCNAIEYSKIPERSCGPVLSDRAMKICNSIPHPIKRRDTIIQYSSTYVKSIPTDVVDVFKPRSRSKRSITLSCCKGLCSDYEIRYNFCEAHDPEDVIRKMN